MAQGRLKKLQEVQETPTYGPMGLIRQMDEGSGVAFKSYYLLSPSPSKHCWLATRKFKGPYLM